MLLNHILKTSLAAATILCACSTAIAWESSYYSTESKFAQGHWVKVATPTEGVYQLTYDDLRELGFSDPSRVQVFGYGATASNALVFSKTFPDDILPTPTHHTSDGRILFFGEGDVRMMVSDSVGQLTSATSTATPRSWYDTASYYFLTDAYGANLIDTNPWYVNTKYADLASHYHYELIEEDLICIGEGGTSFHGPMMNSGESLTYTFPIRNFKPTQYMSQGSFVYWYALNSPTNCHATSTISDNLVETPASSYFQNPHTPNVLYIGSGDYSIYRTGYGTHVFEEDEEHPLQDTEASVTITMPTNALNYAALDKVGIKYPRANSLDELNPWLVMNTCYLENQDGRSHIWPGTKEGDVVMWDVSNPKARIMASEYDETVGGMRFPMLGQPRRMVAFNPHSTFSTPRIVGEVPNQNLHGSDTPDMLIVTTDELLPTAEELAEIHRQYQGMNVKVVDHRQVYNEFSSGARDVMAIRRIAKMYYDRDPKKFKYLLLWGVSSWDNRSLFSSDKDLLPVYENTLETTNNYVTNYGSDLIYGMLSDTYKHTDIFFSPMQIAVGRVPAKTPAEAKNYVEKVRKYMQDRPTADVYARSLIVGGEYDSNTHLSHAIETVNEFNNGTHNFSPILLPVQAYASPGASTDVPSKVTNRSLTDGIGYFSFSGHGDHTFVSVYNIYNVNKAQSLKYRYAPFMMFSSCDQFAYDRPWMSLLEASLLNECGAIAGVGATRSVYIVYNQVSCGAIARAYANAKPGDTFGDMFRSARADLLYRKDMSLIPNASAQMFTNIMSYNLGGDPAVPLPVPECRVKIDRIGDTTPTTGVGSVALKPFETYHLSGHISDIDGVSASDFNGTIKIEILDGVEYADTYNTSNENDYKPVTTSIVQDVIYTTSGKVTDGQFAIDFTPALPSRPDGFNRFIISAIDDATGHTALCVTDIFDIADASADQLVEATEPVITEFYAEDPSFTNGGETSSSPLLVATIDCGTTGIRVATSGPGTSSHLIVDGSYRTDNLKPYIIYQADGTARFEMALGSLTDGRHTAELTIASNSGTAIRRFIDFTVVSRAIEPTISIAEKTATDVATLAIEGSDGADIRIIITDAGGNTIRSISTTGPTYAWDLCDAAGNRVPDGRYTASILAASGSDHGHSAPVEIVVMH